MDQARKLIRLAVFGSPVKHSLSPRIHQLFAAQAGISVEYTATEISEDFLSREVQKLADAGGTGCNITLPLKNRAFQLANRFSERAELAQAANTLVFNSATRWTADSTDGPGLVRDLLDNLHVELKSRRICIVGAGGAAAGILYDLLQQRPASLCLFNRTIGKAESLAHRFSEIGRVETGDLEQMTLANPFDLVINATSAGHHGHNPVLTGNLFGPQSLCYDLSYGAAHNSTRAWCQENGIQCHDGLGMLVEQAADSFQIWTGFTPDTKPVHQALRTLL